MVKSMTAGLWLRVRLHRGRLDRELADGGDPAACAERGLRAKQLVAATTRRRLAHSLRGAVADADAPYAVVFYSAVPVCRRAVAPWREGLLGLADRLEHAETLNPCGVARVGVLLTDGAGPLYNPAAERRIDQMVWWVADGLQPCPPHAWASPLITKLDPEHTTWTCRRCGAIATTDDPVVRPE